MNRLLLMFQSRSSLFFYEHFHNFFYYFHVMASLYNIIHESGLSFCINKFPPLFSEPGVRILIRPPYYYNTAVILLQLLWLKNARHWDCIDYNACCLSVCISVHVKVSFSPLRSYRAACHRPNRSAWFVKYNTRFLMWLFYMHCETNSLVCKTQYMFPYVFYMHCETNSLVCKTQYMFPYVFYMHCETNSLVCKIQYMFTCLFYMHCETITLVWKYNTCFLMCFVCTAKQIPLFLKYNTCFLVCSICTAKQIPLFLKYNTHFTKNITNWIS